MKYTASLLFFSLSFFGAALVHADIGDQLAKYTPTDGMPLDYFGHSVALSGNTALVGAIGQSKGYADAYDIVTGAHVSRLTASDAPEYGNYFGGTVALSGSTAIVGAYSDYENGDYSGAAYVFDVTTGAQLAKLSPDDAAPWQYFGTSVALSGTTAIIGATGDKYHDSFDGAAYVFDVATGTQLAKLTTNDVAGGDFFGESVSLSGNMAIVGASRTDENGADSGSAYVFDLTTGAQLAKLTPDDGATNHYFGKSLAISGNKAIVGATGDTENGSFAGSAYVFDVATGAQLAKLTADDGDAGDYFGWSVSLSGDTAIVGAIYDDDVEFHAGSAYLFDVASGAQLAKLTLCNGEFDDEFGSSVAVDGGRALVGAWLDDAIGSAYLYSTVPEPSSAVFVLLGVGAAVVSRRQA